MAPIGHGIFIFVQKKIRFNQTFFKTNEIITYEQIELKKWNKIRS